MEQISTKVRPKKKYKTDRKDLDGRSGKGITPMTVVKKAPDIAMKTTQTLIPSLKPVYDRYKSGDIMSIIWRFFNVIFPYLKIELNSKDYYRD